MADESQAAEALTQAMPEEADTRPIYEVGYHVVPTVGEDGVAAVVDKIRTALGTSEIISEVFPQKMTLAYTVERSVQGKREKYTESYFGWIKCAAEAEVIPGLEASLRAMPEVLRSLIIHTTREDAMAQPQRAVFSSDRLEGEVIKKPAQEEKGGEVSEEELNKSLDALVSE